MRTIFVVILSQFVCAMAGAQQIFVTGKGKLLTMNPGEQREISENVHISTGHSGDDCVSYSSNPPLSVPAGCVLDTSRTYTTNVSNGFGQGGPGYGVVVNSLNLPGGGQASYTLTGNTFTASAKVCRKRRQRGWYEAKHVLYVKCPALIDWTQTYGPYPLPSTGPWTQLAIIPTVPGTQNVQYTISITPSTTLPVQVGLFKQDPFISGDKGQQLWAKLSPTNDLTLTAMEITQGIQNLDNEVPLVARRRTVVRAYVRASQDNVNGVTATLTATRNGTPLGPPILAENAAAVRTNGDQRVKLDDSFWFVVPPAWREAGPVKFTVNVDTTNVVAEVNESNNSISRDVTFESGSEIVITSVPFHMHENADKNKPVLTFTDADPAYTTLVGNVLRYHPTWAVLYQDCGNPVEFPAFHGAGQEWNMSKLTTQVQILTRVGWARALSFCGSANTHWLGLIHPKVNAGNDGMGMPFGKSSWALMSSQSSGGWRYRGGDTVAHEIGHNRGLGHIDCAGDEYPPKTPLPYPYPHPDCRIGKNEHGFFGFDVYYDRWGLVTPNVISNEPAADVVNRGFPFMGYKNPAWADPFDYCLLMPTYGIPCNFLISFHKMAGPPPVMTEEPLPRFFRPPGGWMLVGGVFDGIATGKVEELEILKMDQVSPNAQTGARGWENARPAHKLVIVQVDAAKKVLSETPVNAIASEVDPRVVPFLELLSVAQGAAGIQIRANGVVVAERMASPNAPVVQIREPRAGALVPGSRIRWSADDADGDKLTYTVLYSPDGGATWRPLARAISESTLVVPAAGRLPGATNAKLRVLASDGYHTSHDDTDFPLTVPVSAPVVRIQQPDGYSVPFGRTVILDGIATDIDEGAITDGARFRWTSNRNGVLGTGRELYTRTLSKGVHQIRLEVTDKDGRKGGAAIRVYVGVPAPVPAPRPDVIAAAVD